MNTKNRFIETSDRLAAGRNNFGNPQKLSKAKIFEGCSQVRPFTTPPNDPNDLQQQNNYLLYIGERVAGELFQECVTTDALIKAWQVLAEATWFSLSKLYAKPEIEAPRGDPKDWFLRFGSAIDQALIDRTSPELRTQVKLQYGERYNEAKISRTQSRWSGQKSELLTEGVADGDTFVLDVLQFFFEERLDISQLNDHLKKLAAQCLSEAIKASSALDFVPRPPGMPPSVTWLVGQAVQIAFRKIIKSQGIYEAVRVTVKRNFKTEYLLAKMDEGGALSYRPRSMNVNNLKTSSQGIQFLKQFQSSGKTDDIKLVEKAVNDATTVTLNIQQFDTLVSFCINIGIPRFLDSTLLKVLNLRNFPQVTEEIRKWVKVEGKDDPELIKRRHAEAELFQSGSYAAAQTVFRSYNAFQLAKSLPGVSRAQNPAAVVGAVGVGFQVLKGFIDNRGDVTFSLATMTGQLCPRDDEAKYKNKAIYQNKSFNVFQQTSGVGGILPMSATFEVKYKYNGYAVGSVSMQHLKNQDAIGWGLDVKADIMPDPDAYNREDGEIMSAIEVTFNYRFSTSIPFRDDDIWIGTYKIFGDGRVVVSDKWTSPP